MVEQLVLYPDSSLENFSGLLETLKQAGFIAAKTDEQSLNSFATGESFTNLVSFLGCSPAIQNPDGSNRSTVQVTFHESGSRFIGGNNVSQPGCYNCKHKYADWQQLIQDWQNNNHTKIICPDCKTEKLIQELNWHHRAAFSNCEIVINNISEGTALPADPLLEILMQQTKYNWHYFYRKK